MLGLLALLLGFSFAIAAASFSNRSNLIVREANAINTAWLRCDLMSDSERDHARDLLRKYADQRVLYYNASENLTREASMAEAEALQEQIWNVISTATKKSPEYTTALLPPFNAMIDIYAVRVAAGRRDLPTMLLLLLLTCSLVATASVGYGCGMAGKRNVALTTALCFLIAAVLWAIVDMDHPTKGIIRVDQQPMLDLQATLNRHSTR